MTKKIWEKKVEISKWWSFASGYTTRTASISVYEKDCHFLWWRWKERFVREYAPLIIDPFYDGEYATNRLVNSIMGELRYEASAYLQ